MLVTGVILVCQPPFIFDNFPPKTVEKDDLYYLGVFLAVTACIASGLMDVLVAKCEEVEDNAWDLAAFRQHEAYVARCCAASRAGHVRAARHMLAAAGAGVPIAIAPEMSDKEATREAVRETMFDCVRREEIKNKSELAAKESSLAESRARHTQDMRRVKQRRVKAKRTQEAEHLAHMQRVEADRQEREVIARHCVQALCELSDAFCTSPSCSFIRVCSFPARFLPCPPTMTACAPSPTPFARAGSDGARSRGERRGEGTRPQGAGGQAAGASGESGTHTGGAPRGGG